jgi:hypothetical protein
MSVQSQAINQQCNHLPYDVPFVKTIKIGVFWECNNVCPDKSPKELLAFPHKPAITIDRSMHFVVLTCSPACHIYAAGMWLEQRFSFTHRNL